MKTKKDIEQDTQNAIEANEASRLQAHETNSKVRDQRTGQIEDNYVKEINEAKTFEDQSRIIGDKDNAIAREQNDFNNRAEGINKDYDKKFEDIKQAEQDQYKALNEPQGESRSKIQAQVGEQQAAQQSSQQNQQQTESVQQTDNQNTSANNQEQPR